MKYLIFLTLILITFSSCQYDPYAHKYTTEEPQNINLAGTYIFKNQTIEYNRKEYQNSKKVKIIPKIRLYKNGTFEVENLPHYKNWEAEYIGLISQKGKWKIDVIGNVDNGNELIKFWGIRLKGLPIDIETVTLMNNKKPYSLIFGFGDADEGKAMIFENEINNDE